MAGEIYIADKATLDEVKILIDSLNSKIDQIVTSKFINVGNTTRLSDSNIYSIPTSGSVAGEQIKKEVLFNCNGKMRIKLDLRSAINGCKIYAGIKIDGNNINEIYSDSNSYQTKTFDIPIKAGQCVTIYMKQVDKDWAGYVTNIKFMYDFVTSEKIVI